MSTPEVEYKLRLSFDVSPATKELFEALQRKSGASSLSEVLIKALSQYEMVVDHQVAGGPLVLDDARKTEAVVRPKVLGSVAFWYGGDIVTQELWYEKDDLWEQMSRAYASLRMLNRDMIPYLHLAKPKYYPTGK
jgi:hypothetical protein